jgi:hypothetical protein
METPIEYERDPKGRFVKGKGGGRPKGIPNKVNAEIKTAIRAVLSVEVEKIPTYLKAVDDPAKKIELITKLLPYILPKITNEKPDGMAGLTHFSIQITD